MRSRDFVVFAVLFVIVVVFSSAKSLPLSLRRLQRRQADVRLADMLASINQQGASPTGCAEVGCGLNLDEVSKRSNADQRLAEMQALLSLYGHGSTMPDPLRAGKRSVEKQRSPMIYPDERDRETEIVYRLLRRLAHEMDERL